MGLDESYLAIRSNILTREPLPLVKAAFVVVSGEESHRNATLVETTKSTATAFAAKTCDNKMSNKVFADVHSNNTIIDTRNSNSLVSLSNEQLSRLMGLLNNSGVSFANLNGTANQHMTVSAKILINVVDISDLGLTVGHPNGNQALITKIVDLKINNEITLYDVLVVLEYTVSLLSVRKIARDKLSYDSQNDHDSGATSIDENTHLESNDFDETDLVENLYENLEFNYENVDLPVNIVRRSFRQTKLPSSLNDFIVEGKVKYGVERVVNYSNLSYYNFSFASSLNKSIEPTCYKDVIHDNN
nr:hypothetical protein [Tanacetum cinerariifolium]